MQHDFVVSGLIPTKSILILMFSSLQERKKQSFFVPAGLHALR